MFSRAAKGIAAAVSAAQGVARRSVGWSPNREDSVEAFADGPSWRERQEVALLLMGVAIKNS